MDDNRFQELLGQALATGRIPEGATTEEQVELRAALAAAGVLRASAGDTRREAAEAMPAARARFERHVAANRTLAADVPVSRPVRQPWYQRLFAAHRGLALVGSAAAVVAVALVALLALRSSGGGVQTAEALSPGDYVQFEGVVQATSPSGGGQAVKLQSGAYGALDVQVPEDTPVVSGDAASPAQIEAGRAVLVAGVVGNDRAITAQSVAITSQGQAAPPQRIGVKKLQRLLPDLQGKVVTFAISADGTHGNVIIEAADGKRYLVPVDERSTQRLLTLVTVLGAKVSVSQAAGNPGGTFSLEVTEAAAGGGRAAVTGVAGVITAREGNVLTVQTRERGAVQVVVRAATRIVVTRNAVDQARFANGKDSGVGHAVAISGVSNPSTGQLIAGLIIVGAKPLRAAP